MARNIQGSPRRTPADRLSNMNEDPTTPPITVVEAATCLGCGCLCDDVRVSVDQNQIVEAENACPIGRSWFLAPRPGEGQPSSTINGHPARLDEAIDRAAEILRAAKAPVVWGLSGTTIEAVAASLAIADQIGAIVDLAGSLDSAAKLAAFQRVGLVSASLGEVKDRADVVVFWGCDPLVTHPRHWERYSVEPAGRFIPGGRTGRFVIVVDARETETSRAADLFIRIDPQRELEVLDALRALVKGVTLDPNRVARSTGLDHSTIEDLAGRLTAARYGAFFHGPGLGSDEAGEKVFVAAFGLVRDLNEGRRFVVMELGAPGNRSGASAVLAWQTGASGAVDFGLGHPRHLPGEASVVERLSRSEVDAVLIVADDPADVLPADALIRFTGVRSIMIAPGAPRGERWPDVAFDVARPGLEAGGTVARVDGVMLPLRPSVSSALPTDRVILERLLERLLDGEDGR